MGERINQGVACLVLTGCGIAMSEIFGAIREDFKFVSLRPKSLLIVNGRKNIVSVSKRILANYSNCS